MSEQTLHDLRAVHDVSSLRGERLAAKAWVLVELRPDPHSGGAMTVGASVDATTGKLIDDATRRELAPDEARTGLVFAGEWQLVGATEDDSASRSGRYSWVEPPKLRLQGLSARDLYDPFALGGVVLCDLDLQVFGREQFGRVRVIFADWMTSMVEARTAFEADPDLLARDLVRIVDGANDVLSVIAFHNLVEQLDALVRATGARQSAFVYLLMHRPDDDAVEPALAAVGASLADPRWFVLGICAARLLDPMLRSSLEWAPRLVAPHRSVTDPYLQECLRVAGLNG